MSKPNNLSDSTESPPIDLAHHYLPRNGAEKPARSPYRLAAIVIGVAMLFTTIDLFAVPFEYSAKHYVGMGLSIASGSAFVYMGITGVAPWFWRS